MGYQTLDSQDTDQPANAVVQEMDHTAASQYSANKTEIAAQVDHIIEHGQPIHMIQYEPARKVYIVSD